MLSLDRARSTADLTCVLRSERSNWVALGVVVVVAAVDTEDVIGEPLMNSQPLFQLEFET
jgi:hypothetical protein